MIYDPEIHHRRSIRLRDYDYGANGAYFVTVCVQGRECLFGEVVGGEVILNPAGEAVRLVWEGLSGHYPHVVLDAFVIMPNHVHGIIMIDDNVGAADVGAADVGAADVGAADVGAADVGAGLRPAQSPETGRSETGRSETGRSETCPYEVGGIKRVPVTEVVRALKSFSARRINQIRDNPGVPVWQRNYYERIIRNEEELAGIRNYIQCNPMRWEEDEENPGNNP